MIVKRSGELASEEGLPLAQPLQIGPVEVPNRVFLAPMSGVSDRAFRAIALAAGAGLVISEMVASEQFVRGEDEARLKSEWAGAGPNLDHAEELIVATVEAVPVPVTLKMRLGWDERSINAAELARRAERAGVRMLTVHGRTRCQFYDGQADWAAVAAVKSAVGIPVIINGDISGIDEALAAVAASGADGVMIGRAAYGQPWLPGIIARLARGELVEMPTPSEIAVAAASHYRALLDLYGAVGIRAARKHLAWYLERFTAAGGRAQEGTRARLMASSAPEPVLAELRQLAEQPAVPRSIAA